MFNPQVLVCDFPFNVPGCAGEESKDQSRDIDLGIPPGYTCPGLGIFPHPECDKYITCYEGETARLWLCAFDYLFDLRYNGCNFPDLTDCGNRTRPGSKKFEYVIFFFFQILFSLFASRYDTSANVNANAHRSELRLSVGWFLPHSGHLSSQLLPVCWWHSLPPGNPEFS